MEQVLSTIGEPSPSEEEFLLVLQLSEDPPGTMTAGRRDWKQMYRMARAGGDHRMTAIAVQNIYSALATSGKAAEATVCARWLLAIAQEAGDPLVAGHARNDIAWAYWVMGDHVAAYQAAQEALTHATTLEAEQSTHASFGFTGPDSVRAMAADLLTQIRHARGQIRQGLADREAALAIHRERGDALQVISALEGLALVHKDLGDQDAAVRCFAEALRVTEAASLSNEQMRLLTRAGLLGNLGVALTHKGETDRALAVIEEAISIYVRLSDSFGRIGALGQKGRALLCAKRVPESIACFHEMVRLAREFDAMSWRQAAHFNLARAYVTAGDVAKAAFHCEQSAALAKEKLGYIGVELHWLRAALFAPPGATRKRGRDGPRFVALAYYALEALHRAVRGSLPVAVVGQWIDEFEILIDIVLNLVPGLSLDLGATAQLDEKSSAGQVIEAMAQNSPFIGRVLLDIALYCVESLRAQGFQERLLLNAADLERRHDPSLVTELARIEAEIQRLDGGPPVVVTGTVSFGDNGELVEGERESDQSIAAQVRAQKEHFRRRAELAASRDQLVRKTLETDNASIAPMPVPASLTDVQMVLREDELFLEFILLGQTESTKRAMAEVVMWPSDERPSGGYVIAITKSWMDVIPLGATAEIETRCAMILEMLDRFRETLSLPFFQSEAAAIYDLLLRPVWRRAGTVLDSVRHLVIAPDGVLHKLPLDLLVEKSGHVHSWREFDFIARRYSTEYVPSATVFVNARRGHYRRGEPGRLFVGFGDPAYSVSWQPAPLDPLPATRQELDRISALVRASAEASGADPVRPFLGVKARKDFLVDESLLSEAKYLHLACHGTAGTAPYLEGAIYLSQTDDSTPMQSVLTAREVMDLRTNAILVVLSSCESGLGTLSRGEGIQGLTRAWLFAGAQAVVASQWRVDDEATTEVMTELYRALLTDGGSVADALVAAKRAAIESDHFACPAFWAAFVLTGGRTEKSPKQLKSINAPVRPARSDVSNEPLERAVLTDQNRALLRDCAREWEAMWESNRPDRSPAFFVAATALGRSLAATRETIEPATRDLLRLVERNCRTAWEHWAKQQRADVATRAYLAYSSWVPSARTGEWDAITAAYRSENRATVLQLGRQGKLTRTFELLVDRELHVDLRTIVTRLPADLDQEINRPVDIAIPVEPSVECSSDEMRYCRDVGWAVFPIESGDAVNMIERLRYQVHQLEEDSFVLGGTWGSLLIPHDLTIRFHSDFIPLKLQRERLGKGASSTAAVRFTLDGAEVRLRPNRGAWLERLAILFRRVPGAIDMFAAPGSPFGAETEFGEFERLLEQARQSQPR